jgi:hypothetical protein
MHDATLSTIPDYPRTDGYLVDSGYWTGMQQSSPLHHDRWVLYCFDRCAQACVSLHTLRYRFPGIGGPWTRYGEIESDLVACIHYVPTGVFDWVAGAIIGWELRLFREGSAAQSIVSVCCATTGLGMSWCGKLVSPEDYGRREHHYVIASLPLVLRY